MAAYVAHVHFLVRRSVVAIHNHTACVFRRALHPGTPDQR